MSKDRPKIKSAFNEASKQDAIIKEMIKSKENLVKLSLSVISSPKTHDRQCYQDSEIVELANSIKNIGLLQPIVVRQIGSRYERLIGFKRIKAYELNGVDKIEAIVLRNISDKEAALITISENLFRTDPNVYDQTLAFLDYVSISIGIEKKEIKKLLNKSKKNIELTIQEMETYQILEKLLMDSLSIQVRTFANKVQILNINSILISSVQKREIPYSIALALDAIKQDSTLEQILTKVVKQKLSLGEVKKLISQYLPTKQTFNINYKYSYIVTPNVKKRINKLDVEKQKDIEEHLRKINEIFTEANTQYLK